MEGPIGSRGPTGLQGIAGPIGPQGVPGPRGPSGPQGITGPIGVQGLVGFPRSSVPVSIQIFTANATFNNTSYGPFTYDAIPTMAYPALNGNTSTTILGMSLNSTPDAIVVPLGKYLVEGACTFPDDENSITDAILSLCDADTPESILVEGNKGGGTASNGRTSYFSQFLEITTTSRNILLRYTGFRQGSGDEPPGMDIPLIAGSSIASFVTFIKV